MVVNQVVLFSYLFVLQFHLLFLFFKLEQHHKVLVVMCSSMGGSDSNADFVAYLNMFFLQNLIGPLHPFILLRIKFFVVLFVECI